MSHEEYLVNVTYRASKVVVGGNEVAYGDAYHGAGDLVQQQCGPWRNRGHAEEAMVLLLGREEVARVELDTTTVDDPAPA